MTFSIWDEPDEAMAELDRQNEPCRRRIRHRKDTRRRGGLLPIAEKASMTIFGMNLRELDREAAKTLPPRRELEAAHEAVRVVAGHDPDHAELANRIGFAKSDVALGHALASAPSHSAIGRPGLALMTWRLAMRYRRQVPPRLNFITGFTDQSDLFD